MFDSKKFSRIIHSFNNELLEVHEDITPIKLTEEKWSLKEIIGHLIDSASNNHQRFVRLQSGDLLDFPAYDGELWIRTQKYNDMPWNGIVTLWYSYNCLILNIVENMDKSAYGNVWIKEEEAIPLEKLINDYYQHIELHVEHFCSRKEELKNK